MRKLDEEVMVKDIEVEQVKMDYEAPSFWEMGVALIIVAAAFAILRM